VEAVLEVERNNQMRRENVAAANSTDSFRKRWFHIAFADQTNRLEKSVRYENGMGRLFLRSGVGNLAQPMTAMRQPIPMTALGQC
jgi:hypothetical protein